MPLRRNAGIPRNSVTDSIDPRPPKRIQIHGEIPNDFASIPDVYPPIARKPTFPREKIPAYPMSRFQFEATMDQMKNRMKMCMIYVFPWRKGYRTMNNRLSSTATRCQVRFFNISFPSSRRLLSDGYSVLPPAIPWGLKSSMIKNIRNQIGHTQRDPR